MRINRVIYYMGFLSALLKVFTCSGQVNSQDKEQSKGFEDQLVKSLEAFKNRPIYKNLTEMNIDTTSDDILSNYLPPFLVHLHSFSYI